ncbi:hypothetical protein LCGC14_2017840 [marine sediment metagenome]|uniref:Uncharacterized protein n=1 Tax=marine sediment metagenome TaxID=412755 RepID=A0A0F9EYF8_9ZZZZ
MTIERLDSDFILPIDIEALTSGDTKLTTEYFVKLVRTLQIVLDEIVAAANFSVTVATGDAVYYKLPGTDGQYIDGTWRTIQVGDNLETQVKISGNFITALVRERPL